MANSNRTREEWFAVLKEYGTNPSEMGEPPARLVRFEPPGMYVIGNVAIFYCPWCGAKLPSFSTDDLRKLGYQEISTDDLRKRGDKEFPE